MITTYPKYLEQTQTIGLNILIEYHGLVHVQIAGVYGITYDRPSTHSRTFDKPATHSRTYDN